MTLLIRPEARDDVRAAMEWHESREPGLGAAFLAEADAVFQQAAAHPGRFPKVHGPLCRALMRRFPYAVYFAAEDHDVIVFAVLHQRRDRNVLDTRQ
jgi:plasmid stabilization system protein ParE